MNPYAMLEKLYLTNSLRAVYVKATGARLSVMVEPEQDATEQLVSDYSGAVTVRAWGIAADSLKDDGGVQYYPGEGDSIEITGTDGATRTYKVAREAVSSKFWRWKWDRPGGRIIFFTKFEKN